MVSITISLDSVAGAPTLTFSGTQDGAGIRYCIQCSVHTKVSGTVKLKHYQETFGEDPWLSGHLTTAYVTGLQGGIELAKS